MHLNFLEINDLLSSKLKEGKPFSCLRIDNTAGYATDCILKGEFPLESIYNPTSLIEAGVYPNTTEYGVNVVLRDTYDVMSKCDILGFVDISNQIRNGPTLSAFGNKPMFFNPDFYVMDPGALLGCATKNFGLIQPEIPWTYYLKGKKVLVISTHVDSIKSQWKRIDDVWGSKKDLITPYELVDVIRSPYHPLMDNRQPPNCETWLDSVNFIKNQIDKYDYDVLLAGCTTSAPFYAQHAKEKGKIGIQTGGVIQLHFGVKGYRWTNVPGHNEWNKIFNEHWIYPYKEDEPNNREKYLHLETNYAYWG